MSKKINQVFKSTKFVVNTKGELVTTSIKPLKETLFMKSHEIWEANKGLLEENVKQPYVIKELINYFVKFV